MPPRKARSTSEHRPLTTHQRIHMGCTPRTIPRVLHVYIYIHTSTHTSIIDTPVAPCSARQDGFMPQSINTYPWHWPFHPGTLRRVPRVRVWVSPALCQLPRAQWHPSSILLLGLLCIPLSPNPSCATSFFQCWREEGVMSKPTPHWPQAQGVPSHPDWSSHKISTSLRDGTPTPGSATRNAGSAGTHQPLAPRSAGCSHPGGKNGIRALQSTLRPLMLGTLWD